MHSDLTEKHLEAIRGIVDGADVWELTDAKLLREVEKLDPELLWIGHPQNECPPGHKRQPYFGAYLKKAGCRLLMRQALRDEMVKAWLRQQGDAVVGYVRIYGYEEESWLKRYIKQATGLTPTISNLSIGLDDEEELFQDDESEKFVCGWDYQSPQPAHVPSLEAVAPWLPAVLEWIVGDDGGQLEPVTGRQVLAFIEAAQEAKRRFVVFSGDTIFQESDSLIVALARTLRCSQVPEDEELIIGDREYNRFLEPDGTWTENPQQLIP